MRNDGFNKFPHFLFTPTTIWVQAGRADVLGMRSGTCLAAAWRLRPSRQGRTWVIASLSPCGREDRFKEEAASESCLSSDSREARSEASPHTVNPSPGPSEALQAQLGLGKNPSHLGGPRGPLAIQHLAAEQRGTGRPGRPGSSPARPLLLRSNGQCKCLPRSCLTLTGGGQRRRCLAIGGGRGLRPVS